MVFFYFLESVGSLRADRVSVYEYIGYVVTTSSSNCEILLLATVDCYIVRRYRAVIALCYVNSIGIYSEGS